MCLTGISIAGVDRDMVFCAERFGKRETNLRLSCRRTKLRTTRLW